MCMNKYIYVYIYIYIYTLSYFETVRGDNPWRTSLLIFHLEPIREQPITKKQLVRTVGRYRDVMMPRTFGIYNAPPLDHATIPDLRVVGMS